MAGTSPAMTKNSGRELLPHRERQPDDDGRADALDRADAHGAAVQLGERAGDRSRSKRSDFCNAAPDGGDQLLAVSEVTFLGIQDALKRSPLQREYIDAVALRVDPGRIADDVHEPFERMQAAEQIIILAVAAG